MIAGSDAVSGLVRALFGPGIAVAVLDPRLPHPGQLPEEAAAIVGARAPRQREFATGRAAAHMAMARLGADPQPVPSGPDRAPVWPSGLVGSIAHDAETCVAVVARVQHARALGVDVEPAQPLEPALWDSICMPDELAWLAEQPPARRGLLARLIFSAKEAAYKAQYPLTRSLFGFETVRIELTGTGMFLARFQRDVAPFCSGAGLPGRYRLGAGRIVTGLSVDAGHVPGLGGATPRG